MNINDVSSAALGALIAAAGDPQPSQWSDVKTWLAIAGAATSAFLAWLAFRKDKHTEVSGQMDVKLKLDQLIDERVERQLTSAWKEIDHLKSQVKELLPVREENTQMKGVIRRHFESLISWERRGRPGAMPLPDATDVALLGLEHPIEDTLSREDRDSMLGR